MNKEVTNKKYTTQLQAGLGILNETELLIDLWEEGMDNKELLDKALTEGLFPNISARRLRNIVNEAFAARYLVDEGRPAMYLQFFKENFSADAFIQVALLYTCRANPILGDFICDVYWPKYSAGIDSLTRDDAQRFVLDVTREGYTEKIWADSTVKRVSSYLLGACSDFGLLKNSKGFYREIESFRITSEVAVFLAYELHFSGLGDNSVILHDEWNIYGLAAEDVKEAFKQMALKGHLIYQSTGTAARISWKYKKMDEVLHGIIE